MHAMKLLRVYELGDRTGNGPMLLNFSTGRNNDETVICAVQVLRHGL